MSLSDEIERIKKEEADKNKQYLEQQLERENSEKQYCEESLNGFFSKHYKIIARQNDFFITTIKALEIINILVELRQIANLAFEHRKEKFVNKYITETTKVPIPAKIVISRISTEGIFGLSTHVDDIDSDWSTFFSNILPKVDYYSLKQDFVDSGYSKIDKDFLNYLKEWFKKIDLKKPLIQGYKVEMLWNYVHLHDSDFSASIESYESLTISVEKDILTIFSSNEKHQFPSIRLINCTPQWIRKEIAKAHVKHKFH